MIRYQWANPCIYLLWIQHGIKITEGHPEQLSYWGYSIWRYFLSRPGMKIDDWVETSNVYPSSWVTSFTSTWISSADQTVNAYPNSESPQLKNCYSWLPMLRDCFKVLFVAVLVPTTKLVSITSKVGSALEANDDFHSPVILFSFHCFVTLWICLFSSILIGFFVRSTE